MTNTDESGLGHSVGVVGADHRGISFSEARKLAVKGMPSDSSVTGIISTTILIEELKRAQGEKDQPNG